MPRKPDPMTGTVVQSSPASALLTLANTTAFITNGLALTRGCSLLSVSGSLNVHSLTAGDGPFLTGLMHGDLTLAELEEYLELNGPLTPADITGSEIASRGKRIRILGVLEPEAGGLTASMALKDISLRGLVAPEADESQANSWTLWIYNLGKALTTGSLWGKTLVFFVRWNKSG